MHTIVLGLTVLAQLVFAGVQPADSQTRIESHGIVLTVPEPWQPMSGSRIMQRNKLRERLRGIQEGPSGLPIETTGWFSREPEDERYRSTLTIDLAAIGAVSDDELLDAAAGGVFHDGPTQVRRVQARAPLLDALPLADQLVWDAGTRILWELSRESWFDEEVPSATLTGRMTIPQGLLIIDHRHPRGSRLSMMVKHVEELLLGVEIKSKRQAIGPCDLDGDRGTATHVQELH